MTTAYYCVLVAILFPFIFTVLAKTSRRFNNHDPRAYLENLTGWRKRANYVQLNSFEAIAPFGLSVIIAELTHAPQLRIDQLAIVFLIMRALYAVCYLMDWASLRTLFWTLGVVCVVSFYFIS